MNRTKSQDSSGVFRWVDTPWTVAAALGVWGVMIGLEQFLAANIVAFIAAVFAVIRLSKETLIWTRRRHTLPFVFGLLVIVSLIVVDFWWTAHQKAASEAKQIQLAQLNEIPILQQTIKEMTKSAQDDAKAQAVEQGKLEQRLSDIGDDNKKLKTSIEEKDAALAKIALDQYALNFAPQVVPITNGGSPYVLTFSNLGKTNVSLRNVKCDRISSIPVEPIPPGLVAPNTSMNFTLSDSGKQAVLAYAPAHQDGKAPFECNVMILTLDKKSYRLDFTWYFVVKDGAASQSFTISHQIKEVN